jgi:hypothetical protein
MQLCIAESVREHIERVLKRNKILYRVEYC